MLVWWSFWDLNWTFSSRPKVLRLTGTQSHPENTISAVKHAGGSTSWLFLWPVSQLCCNLSVISCHSVGCFYHQSPGTFPRDGFARFLFFTMLCLGTSFTFDLNSKQQSLWKRFTANNRLNNYAFLFVNFAVFHFSIMGDFGIKSQLNLFQFQAVSAELFNKHKQMTRQLKWNRDRWARTRATEARQEIAQNPERK